MKFAISTGDNKSFGIIKGHKMISVYALVWLLDHIAIMKAISLGNKQNWKKGENKIASIKYKKPSVFYCVDAQFAAEMYSQHHVSLHIFVLNPPMTS